MIAVERKLAVTFFDWKVERKATSMHNITLIFGFVMVMLAGWLTVVLDISSDAKNSQRAFRSVKRAGGRMRNDIINLFDE